MISLIATVKNEQEGIAAWFNSLAKQTVRPDEIVVVDGGSTDGTWEWLKEKAAHDPNVHVSQKEGNISVGRNTAIAAATGTYIVVADAGCTYEPTWLEAIQGALTSGATFVATAFKPLVGPGDTVKTVVLAAATTPRRAEFTKDWLPSSRSVAFTKELWHTVGGYPEWLPICEDIVFDKAVLQEQPKVVYIREPLVAWAPRPTVWAYLKQLYKYTRGDGHAHLFLHRQLIRYCVYGAALILLILSAVQSSVFLLPLVLSAPLYLHKFYMRFAEYSTYLPMGRRMVGWLALPVIIALGDIAKMAGYPIGLLQKLTGMVHNTP